MTEQPAYVTHYLPALILTAFGVALCLPQLSSVSVQGLPPDSFGSGSAVMQAVRNLGATLGVALVVAFTSDRVGTSLASFQHVWWLLVASGLSVTALTFNLPRRAKALPSGASWCRAGRRRSRRRRCASPRRCAPR